MIYNSIHIKNQSPAPTEIRGGSDWAELALVGCGGRPSPPRPRERISPSQLYDSRVRLSDPTPRQSNVQSGTGAASVFGNLRRARPTSGKADSSNPRPAGPSPDPARCWGGGGGRSAPHLSRKPTDVDEKFKRQWKGLDKIFQIKFKNLTSRSPVTSQVRSNTKCLTFPFNAFPRQNAGNKRISSR